MSKQTIKQEAMNTLRRTAILIVMVLISSAILSQNKASEKLIVGIQNGADVASRFKLPEGYHRMETEEGTFEYFLQHFELYRWDYCATDCYGNDIKATCGVLKLDLIGENLQQCADACIRLRAEWLRSKGRPMVFHTVQNKERRFVNGSEKEFRNYLKDVFSYCNTVSLEKYDTHSVTFEEARIGDIVIEGGFPGHCVIIMDIAISDTDSTKKAFIFAESYMPAREMTILPSWQEIGKFISYKHNPWFKLEKGESFNADWLFDTSMIRRFND